MARITAGVGVNACYTTGSFLSDMISHLYTLIDGEPDYKVYLTGKGNFRHDIAVTEPYKGNRKEKEKPVHLEAIRQYLIKDWNAVVSEGEEADDLIAIDATAIPFSANLNFNLFFFSPNGFIERSLCDESPKTIYLFLK